MQKVQPMEFNYRIYTTQEPYGSVDRGSIHITGSYKSHSIRGMKTFISKHAPGQDKESLKSEEWEDGSENEYYKQSPYCVLYIHITNFAGRNYTGALLMRDKNGNELYGDKPVYEPIRKYY